MLGMKAMVEKWFNKAGGRAGTGSEGDGAGSGSGDAPAAPAAVDPAADGGDPILPVAEFALGEVVRHRFFPFRGVIFDVDPEFANTEEWWEAIPAEVRPRKDQPFYHLFAENEESAYVAYVSQQNLLPDDSGLPIGHPAIAEMFDLADDGSYVLKRSQAN
jgi:heat shock protein HspQ